MQRIGTARRKTRGKFKKNRRSRGKISLTRYFQRFEPGQKVVLGVESAVQKGMYHARFMGKVGVIKAHVGRCCEVLINDGKKEKTLIIHPVHLKKA